MYSVIFDGWTESSRHFIGLFITAPGKFPDSLPITYLLACAPLTKHDETSFNAENHKDFIVSTLEYYRIPITKLVALIGDNCSTNKALANLLGKSLIGCGSHRLNIGVEAYIKNTLETEVEVVSRLMSKLGTLKQSGRMRLYTELRPKLRNVTRWTGVLAMFEQYAKIRSTLDKMGDEIRELLPSLPQERNIKGQMKPLNDLKKATVALQKHEMTMLSSSYLWENIIEEFPDFNFKDYIGNDAKIVLSPKLEQAVIKIQARRQYTLTPEEKLTVATLLLKNSGGLFYYNFILKR